MIYKNELYNLIKVKCQSLNGDRVSLKFTEASFPEKVRDLRAPYTTPDAIHAFFICISTYHIYFVSFAMLIHFPGKSALDVLNATMVFSTKSLSIFVCHSI